KAALIASNTQGEQVTSRFEFEVLVVPPLGVRVLADELDLLQRRIAFVADRPVVRVELELFDEVKQLVAHEQQLDRQVAAGEPVRVQWPAAAGGDVEEIKRIEMRVYDRDGFWSGQEFKPWWLELEHEEVNFDTGKATYHPAEEKKLDRTMQALNKVLAEHAQQADLRLYVAGYTDTVGTAESNMTLSLERALAIARAFGSKGLRIPIFYQGFGETVLAVPTADGVDEQRNRRAIYVLGNAPPPPSGAIPRRDWRRL
ncbi:MAG: OmpA family protein, partial [Deltaproteobacteria bacterium]|nr:OmpA family protein [Deltaproteobacteria bacterium]